LNGRYIQAGKTNRTLVAKRINEKYHDGVSVRTPRGVYARLKQLKNKKSK